MKNKTRISHPLSSIFEKSEEKHMETRQYIRSLNKEILNRAGRLFFFFFFLSPVSVN